MLDLRDKTILVTGASSGIGRATAIALSQLGASTIISGRNKTELNVTLSRMNSDNNLKHCVLPFDFSNLEKINELLGDLRSFSDKIDGVVHCAGISMTESLRSINLDSADQLININLKSAIHLIASLRKNKLFNKNASVILFSSTAALTGEPGLAVYSATKGAIISLTKSLAAELVNPDRIRVNCLVPGIVKTELVDKKFKHFTEQAIESMKNKYPLGFGSPEDVAGVVAFFLSDMTKWITGSDLVMDGGQSLG